MHLAKPGHALLFLVAPSTVTAWSLDRYVLDANVLEGLLKRNRTEGVAEYLRELVVRDKLTLFGVIRLEIRADLLEDKPAHVNVPGHIQGRELSTADGLDINDLGDGVEN